MSSTKHVTSRFKGFDKTGKLTQNKKFSNQTALFFTEEALLRLLRLVLDPLNTQKDVSLSSSMSQTDTRKSFNQSESVAGNDSKLTRRTYP